MQMITVLGATGSIGVSTLDVVARHPDKYAVFALTAHTQIDKLAEQCEQFSPKFAVVGNAALADQLQTKLRVRGSRTEVIYGVDALCQVSSDAAVDSVMAAIVGAAGLVPTLAHPENEETNKSMFLAVHERRVHKYNKLNMYCVF